MKIGIPYTGCKHVSEVPVTREDEALAFAAGVIIGGGECSVFMGESGFGNCINVIATFLKPYKITVPMEVNVRYEPEHHKFMGEIMTPLMEILGYETGNRKDNV